MFAVTMVNGPAWDPSRSRRQQRGWDEHAAFMDDLVDAGCVVLGGPVGPGDEVLLAWQANDAAHVERQLAGDPWLVSGVLRIGEIRPWTIWLDGRNSSGRASG